jgi:hypothetical protein
MFSRHDRPKKERCFSSLLLYTAIARSSAPIFVHLASQLTRFDKKKEAKHGVTQLIKQAPPLARRTG